MSYFLRFSELFPAFNCTEVIGDLPSIWSGVYIFSPCLFYFFVQLIFHFLNQAYLLVFLKDCKIHHQISSLLLLTIFHVEVV